ncbi:MAG: hypothetical protein KC418_04600 [Anaerolineales bacterium]|nr:hypothetical protein [Anaerolineales bacterium]MCB8952236.1 restriction endonuclease [Ardenticatenales bacterium]
MPASTTPPTTRTSIIRQSARQLRNAGKYNRHSPLLNKNPSFSITTMSSQSRQTLSLAEYTPHFLPAHQLPEALGTRLWQQYGRQISVEFPSPKTGGQWRLTSLGWVGHIPLHPDFHLRLQPKTPLANLFGMMTYAYRLRSWRWLDGLTTSASLPEFYEQLARLLAERVLLRARQGLRRDYVSREASLPFLRGRLNLAAALRQPPAVTLPCRYQEQTTDTTDNQILAWTLWLVAHSPLLSDSTRLLLRRAFWTLHGLVRLRPVLPWECLDRPYDRLNLDYAPLHAICRFFLTHTGPDHQSGGEPMWPFLVDMARLYELFVAEWLQAHLPAAYTLKAQEQVSFDDGALRLRIDLALYHAAGASPLAVLDTKYKLAAQPTAEDVTQIVAYAQAKQCAQAILIYPAPLARPFHIRVGQVQVRALPFALDGDLEAGGEWLLAQLALV